MLMNAYVIFDSKAQMYNKPFYYVNNMTALRDAQQILASPDHEIAQNPGDYTLFKIGTYNDGTATFDLLETKEVICMFSELPTPEVKLDLNLLLPEQIEELKRQIEENDNA